MKLSELQDKLHLQNFTNELFEKEITGVFISDMVSEIMAKAEPGNALITIQTHKNVLAAANLVDVCAIIIANGKQPNDDTIKLAIKAKLTILGTEENSWKLAQKLFELGIK